MARVWPVKQMREREICPSFRAAKPTSLDGRQGLIADGDAETVVAGVLGDVESTVNDLDLEQEGPISEETRRQVQETVAEIIAVADQHLRDVERISGETVQKLLPFVVKLAKLKSGKGVERAKPGPRQFSVEHMIGSKSAK